MTDPKTKLIDELCERFVPLWRRHWSRDDRPSETLDILRELLAESVYCEDEHSEWLLIGARDKNHKVSISEIVSVLQNNRPKSEQLDVAERIIKHGIEV
jgi:hypothetical protein